jgi:hypothetical protein
VRPVLVYTLSRLGLFLVTALVLYLVGLQNIVWLIPVAFVVSGVASYVLLSGQRDAVSSRISGKVNRPKPQDD